MTRRRPHTRRQRLPGLVPLVVIGLALLTASVVVPTSPYAVGDAGRPGGLDVSDDDTALVGLPKADGVDSGDTEWLVTVGNNFSQVELDVTVALTPPSRTEAYIGVDGTYYENETQFVLGAGASQDVDVCVDDDFSIPEYVTFNVTSAGTGSDVSGRIDERRVPVTDSLNLVDCDGLL